MTAQHLMITKGALHNVLAVCSHGGDSRRDSGGSGRGDGHRSRASSRSSARRASARWAWRTESMGTAATISKDDEAGMTFLGFLVLFDPPKAGIAETIADLKRLGVSLKIITGDNRLVAASVGRAGRAWRARDPHRAGTARR